MSDLDLTQVFEEGWETIISTGNSKFGRKLVLDQLLFVNKRLREMYVYIMQITALTNCGGDMVSHTEPLFIYLM
jgi:hypothetical protein